MWVITRIQAIDLAADPLYNKTVNTLGRDRLVSPKFRSGARRYGRVYPDGDGGQNDGSLDRHRQGLRVTARTTTETHGETRRDFSNLTLHNRTDHLT